MTISYYISYWKFHPKIIIVLNFRAMKFVLKIKKQTDSKIYIISYTITQKKVAGVVKNKAISSKICTFVIKCIHVFL